MKEYINCNQYGIRHNKDEIVKKYRGGVVAVSPKQTRYFKDKEMMTLHRVDGPAVEYSGGVKLWYVDGKQHRTDGPAVVYSNGSREWYVNGAKLTEEEFKAKGK